MKKHMTSNATLIQICQRLHQRGYISAYGGNVSMRIGSKIVITPTKQSLAEIDEDDLVVIDTEGNSLFGVHKPSSETLLHLLIYRERSDVNGIIHTHPPACTTFTYINKEIIPIIPEAREYLKKVPIAPFHPVGSPELAREVANYIMESDVVMLERHGLVTVGQNLHQAYNLTELAEETSMMNMYLHMMGYQE